MAIESQSNHDYLGAGGVDIGANATRRLESEGFVVFEASRAKRSDDDFTFDSLSQFFRCARELGIHVIFLESQALQEDAFFEDAVGPSDRDDDSAAIDLRKIEKRLKAFEKHIDETQLVVLTGSSGSLTISYFETATWAEEYEHARELALEQLHSRYDEAEERLERERAEKAEELLATIRALSEDHAFKGHFATSRPTQGAIVAYVRTNVTGSEQLAARALRDAANYLRDRLLLAQ